MMSFCGSWKFQGFKYWNLYTFAKMQTFIQRYSSSFSRPNSAQFMSFRLFFFFSFFFDTSNCFTTSIYSSMKWTMYITLNKMTRNSITHLPTENYCIGFSSREKDSKIDFFIWNQNSLKRIKSVENRIYLY